MDRNDKFNQKFNYAVDYLNSELGINQDIDDGVLERIRNMRNRYNMIPESEKPFEEYKKAIFEYYTNRMNVKVVIAEKLVGMLMSAIEEYHQTPKEEFHDS